VNGRALFEPYLSAHIALPCTGVVIPRWNGLLRRGPWGTNLESGRSRSILWSGMVGNGTLKQLFEVFNVDLRC